MAIQLGNNLLSGGGSGGAGTPINSYGAFYVTNDEKQFTDNLGSVWLQTGTTLHITGTGNQDDAQIYIDQGANTLGSLNVNSSFGGSGSALLSGFNDFGQISAANRSPGISYDGLGDQLIITNAKNDLTEFRYRTLSLDGNTLGTQTSPGVATLGGAVSPDGTTHYAIYFTACDATQGNSIVEVTGTYPYTQGTVHTTTGLGAAGGSRSLLVSADHYLVFIAHQTNVNFIDAIDRTNPGAGVTRYTLPNNYLDVWQESGQSEIFWAALAGSSSTNTLSSPNYIHQFRHTPTGPILTGVELTLDHGTLWKSPEASFIGMDPANEDMYFITSVLNDVTIAEYDQPGIGDPTLTYTSLPDINGTNRRHLRNYVKIGNQ